MKKKMKRSLDLDSKCDVSLNKYRLYEGLCTKISENVRTHRHTVMVENSNQTQEKICALLD